MNFHDYLSLDALSASALEDVIEPNGSPSIYYGRHIARHLGDRAATLPPREWTDATELGTALHSLVLEGPEAYEERTAVWRGGKTTTGEHTMHRGTNAYKAFEAAARARYQTIISESDHETVQAMAAALYAHDDARRLLFDWPGEAEVSVEFDQNGVACKARFDRVLPERDIIVDLKSAMTTATTKLERQATDLGYARKAEWYRRAYLANYGRPLRAFVFVSVPSCKPYTDVVAWSFDAQAESIAALEIDRALADLVARLQSGDWRPKRCRDIQTVGRPLWSIDSEIRDRMESYQ